MVGEGEWIEPKKPSAARWRRLGFHKVGLAHHDVPGSVKFLSGGDEAPFRKVVEGMLESPPSCREGASTGDVLG